MAENIVIYVGTQKVGKLKKQAVEREAKRTRLDGSVSGLIFDMLEKFGSKQLKEDLEAAERAVLRK